MGVIKRRFSLLAPQKTSDRLVAVWGDAMVENGCTAEQVKALCHKVAMMAYNAMNREYTVMGGYSADEQLFDKAQQLLGELDESGKLEEMLEGLESDETQSKEVSEPDLEDAYHVADAISFTGSENQIKWAHDIAINHAAAIAQSGITINRLPSSAKWWIDNRHDVYTALKGIK